MRRVSATVETAVLRAESARSLSERPSNPDPLDLVVRALALDKERNSLQRCAEAQALFAQALKLDPRFLAAIVGSRPHNARAVHGPRLLLVGWR